MSDKNNYVLVVALLGFLAAGVFVFFGYLAFQKSLNTPTSDYVTVPQSLRSVKYV